MQKNSLLIFSLPRRSLCYEKIVQVERKSSAMQKNSLLIFFIAETQACLSKKLRFILWLAVKLLFLLQQYYVVV